MRVLFVSHKYPPQKGGVAVSARRIAAALGGWCESVHVLHATRELPPGVVQSHQDGSPTVFTMGETERGAESGQLMETTIRALHQQFDYQLVVGFYAVPTGYQAVFTAAFLGLPSVLCLRGNDLDRALYQDGQNAALRWALERAARVVGVSREIVKKASLLSGRSDLVYIPNSVDAESFFPLEVEPEPRSLLFTGEMRLKKGSEILFDALTQLEGDWSLSLVGGFRGRAEVEFRKWSLRERDAASRVRVLPYERDVEHLRALYNRAGLVINPALWDGMPNSVLEAMACARPVLTTRVGGIEDLVEHGKTGYLMDLSELGDLAAAIESALQDPRREKIGQAARRHVLSHHAQDVEAKAFKELLESTLREA